jgi:hypothetical protein
MENTATSTVNRGYASYVAVGDSFTEGMCDDLLPDGHYRGWADRVAARLAAEQPQSPFRYANLAVRGKLIGQIHDEQVPGAAAMQGELVTLAGGLNDVLRPGCDIARVEDLLGRSAAALLAAGATVVLFTSTDPTRRMAGSARLLPAVLRMKAFVEGLGADPRVAVVDLFSAPCFDDRRLWAEDRLRLARPAAARPAARPHREAPLRPALARQPPRPVDRPPPHRPLLRRRPRPEAGGAGTVRGVSAAYARGGAARSSPVRRPVRPG